MKILSLIFAMIIATNGSVTLLYEDQMYAEQCVIQQEFESQFANDTYILAKLVWGEARGVETTEEKAAVVWTVLNRVDDSGYPNTIEEVVKQESQFDGYDETYPVDEELLDICIDVVERWYSEKKGIIDIGRVLPKEYLYFSGDGIRNYFTTSEGTVWDWSYDSPYTLKERTE